MVTDLSSTTFEQALAETEGSRRHLLLGNGFSIALDGCFSYRSLYDVALGLDRSLAFLFHAVGVTDGNFEAAMARTAECSARERLRECLIEAVAAVHPRQVTRSALESCSRFLEDFVAPSRGDHRGTLFTTNYDLLLYRVLIHGNDRLRCYDSFDSEGFWSAGAMWRSHAYFLHGALHLFRREIASLDGRLPPTRRYLKLMADSGTPLLPKIRSHLRQGDSPIFVSEGTAAEKVTSIRRHGYLSKVRRHFRKCCDMEESVLFTLGHSLDPSDSHIFDQLGRSSLKRVYLGIFSSADVGRAERLVARWRAERGSAAPAVTVYDTRGCAVWNDTPSSLAA